MNTSLISLASAGLVAVCVSTAFLGSTPVQATTVPICTNPAKGVLQDFYGKANSMLVTEKMNTVQMKNTSRTCAYRVGIASYKAYERYEVSVYSQTYYASQTIILQPGQAWTYTIAVPSCAYQVDVYHGSLLRSFTNHATTYSGQGRLLDGWFYPGSPNNVQLPMCQKVVSTPTPSPSPTPVPTVKPTCTPTPTVVPTTAPTPIATPSPTPIPQVLGATPTPTPTVPSQLPATGPGVAVATAMTSLIIGLVGKKLTS